MLKRSNITARIGVLLLIPVIGAIAALAYFYSYLEATRHDGHAINVAGKQRLMSQQMHHYADMVAQLNQEEGRLGLRLLVDAFDRSLWAIEHGGEIDGHRLDNAAEEILPGIQAVKESWQQFKPRYLTISNTPFGSPEMITVHDFIAANNQRLTEASDRVVNAMERRGLTLRETMFYVLALIAILDGILLGAAIWVLKRYAGERWRNEQALARDLVAQQVIASILKASAQPTPLNQFLGWTLDLLFTVPWLATESKGCVFLVSEETGRLVMSAQRNLSPEIRSTCRQMAPGQCLCGCAATNGTIEFVFHVDE